MKTRKKIHQEKENQLGVALGTAANRLRKSIMFSMAKRLNEHI
jgi:hypothetical protein